MTFRMVPDDERDATPLDTGDDDIGGNPPLDEGGQLVFLSTGGE